MMRVSLLAVALLASSPALALSPDTASTQASEATEASPGNSTSTEQPKEERKICKRFTNSESRLGAKKICMTAAQWKKQRNF